MVRVFVLLAVPVHIADWQSSGPRAALLCSCGIRRLAVLGADHSALHASSSSQNFNASIPSRPCARKTLMGRASWQFRCAIRVSSSVCCACSLPHAAAADDNNNGLHTFPGFVLAVTLLTSAAERSNYTSPVSGTVICFQLPWEQHCLPVACAPCSP